MLKKKGNQQKTCKKGKNTWHNSGTLNQFPLVTVILRKLDTKAYPHTNRDPTLSDFPTKTPIFGDFKATFESKHRSGFFWNRRRRRLRSPGAVGWITQGFAGNSFRLLYFMEKPSKMDDLGGISILGHPHLTLKPWAGALVGAWSQSSVQLDSSTDLDLEQLPISPDTTRWKPSEWTVTPL